MLLTRSCRIVLLLLTVGSGYQYVYRDFTDVQSFHLLNDGVDDSDDESVEKIVSRPG